MAHLDAGKNDSLLSRGQTSCTSISQGGRTVYSLQETCALPTVRKQGEMTTDCLRDTLAIPASDKKTLCGIHIMVSPSSKARRKHYFVKNTLRLTLFEASRKF